MRESRHGAQYAYKVLKCRCDPCKAWNTAQQRKYRTGRKERGGKMVNGRWKTVQG